MKTCRELQSPASFRFVLGGEFLYIFAFAPTCRSLSTAAGRRTQNYPKNSLAKKADNFCIFSHTYPLAVGIYGFGISCEKLS